MIELQGTHNKAIVYADDSTVDAVTKGQVTALLNQESVSNSTIRIMPDCHAGAGSVIGTTMTITDNVIPNIVGVDIGCGVLVVKLDETRIDLPKLDSLIKKEIPAGFEIRNTPHKNSSAITLENLRCAKYVNIERAYNSIGTLGGGNHFIEIDEDENQNKYLVIHTGS